jgi:hypothetical protein
MAILEVTVTVYERDAERISYIGSKSWGIATEEERKEFDQFIRFYGSMVCHKVFNNK